MSVSDPLPHFQTLAELLIERPLAEYVTEKRIGRPKWSWREIAEQLAEDTGGKVAVTAETLRVRFGETVAA